MAMATGRHDALLLLAVAFAAAAASCFSPAAAGGNPPQSVAAICQRTPYKELCTGTEVSRYPTVDALTVLRMQVDAFAARTSAAREHIVQVSGAASPAAKTVLALCDTLYSDVEDNLGAARRAIGFKDAVTIRAMMGMAAQDIKGCDEQFKQVGEVNPMSAFDQSLLNISENCRALSNMI